MCTCTNIISPLTFSRKKEELSLLQQAIENNKVDKQLIPYLERLNAIEGICTQFCCMGHKGQKYGNLIFFVGSKIESKLREHWEVIAAWPECTNI
jgi:predicted site-specific integrase-resolvase